MATELPWLFPYQEDGPRRLGQIVQRPIVPVALAGSEVTPGLFALVDSGCSHVLAAPWVAHSAGVDPHRSIRELELGLGGTVQRVRFVDMKVRLLAPEGDDDQFLEWEAEVGFVQEWKPPFSVLLGQVGFLDQFTVTMSRHALQTAVEPVDRFDERFGIPLAPRD